MKTQRQAKIMEIISSQNVETQEQLLSLLQAEGFRGTQATISRDIKELRIVKELTSLGTYRYTAAGNESAGSFSSRLNAIFRECGTGFDYKLALYIALLGAQSLAYSYFTSSFRHGHQHYVHNTYSADSK